LLGRRSFQNLVNETICGWVAKKGFQLYRIIKRKGKENPETGDHAAAQSLNVS